MSPLRANRTGAWLLAVGAAALFGLPPARADDGVEGVTAVSSRVTKDYVRAKLADGSFQPEAYAFGQGGHWGGELSDPTVDRLHFVDVARPIAAALAGQNYVPATDPRTTRLLIMVYWGTTAVPGTDYKVAKTSYQLTMDQYVRLLKEDPAAADGMLAAALAQISMADRLRDRIDYKNAGMLGYGIEGFIGTDYGNNIAHTALGLHRNDLVAEIEENRYFVVLMAYDFQLLWKDKKHRLVWETRFSMSERHNQFDRALPVMAQYASRYFGQDSKGLLRTQVPEGQVKVGEPTLVEYLFGPAR